MKANKKNAQIHIRVTGNTRKQWLVVCDVMKGNTQSQVFRNIIQKLYSSVEKASNIKNYE